MNTKTIRSDVSRSSHLAERPKPEVLACPPRRPLVDAQIRCLDIAVSGVGLLFLSPLLGLLAIVIRWESAGPVCLRQTRVGKNFRPFQVYKLRTMVDNAANIGSDLTVGNDTRITNVGRVLRRCKLDELPQLYNVLKGDMSLVGPRPEVPRYVEMFRPDYETILTVRPGITDPASISFLHEAEILTRYKDHEEAYVNAILPQKIHLSKEYLQRRSMRVNLTLLWQTFRAIFAPPAMTASLPSAPDAQGTTHVS
jgi:lipopolysaccharide/colanic/teichoic acid biosynthesis glycosyltransferase